jgi:hypothetical protein
MGWTIGVESRQGQGTFIFIIVSRAALGLAQPAYSFGTGASPLAEEAPVPIG